MEKTFVLPDLGEGLTEAQVRAWYVRVGETVEVDQPLVAVETAKALVEVPAPYAGTVVRLAAEPGSSVRTGAPLVVFEVIAEASTREDAGTVVGSLETQAHAVERAAHGLVLESASSVQQAVFPAVRALARRYGVDVASVTPTGPQGQLCAEDIRNAVSNAPSSVSASARTMAVVMTKAHRSVVPATIQDVVSIQHWEPQTDKTVRIIAAMVAACRAVPALNAHYEERSGRVAQQEVHLGLALDAPSGLYVPVLHNAQDADAAALRTEIERFKDYAVQASFPMECIQGATITLSNFGSIGAGRHGHLVVVPPTVAIVGVGRIYEAVVAEQGKPVVRRSLPLSLTFDHRAVTGAEAARFLAQLMQGLEA